MKSLIKLFIIGYVIHNFTLCAQSNICYSVFVDSSNTPINKVISKKFKPLVKPSVNFGFKPFTVWVKVDFQNLPSTNQLILSSLNAANDSITCYVFYNSGKMDTQFFGTLIEAQNIIYQNPMALKLSDSISVIYIKTKSHSFLRDEYQVQEIKTFHKQKITLFLLYGLITGVFLVMFIYNLSLYIKLKEIAYLYYGVYLLFMCVMLFYIEGIGNAFIWKNNIICNHYLEQISLVFSVFGLSFYSIRVLNIKTHSRLIYNSIKTVGLGSLCIIPFLFLLSPLLSSQITGIFPLFCMILVLIAAIIAVVKNETYAKFYILGWAVFMVTAIGRILYNIGVIDYNHSIVIINYFGCLIEATVFTWLISVFLKNEQEKNLVNQLKLEEYSEELDELKKSIEKLIHTETPITINPKKNLNIELSDLLKTALTEREQDVLKELVKGITYQQIGENLFISKNTVKTHVLNIYEKLDVKNRTEAINKAQKLKLD